MNRKLVFLMTLLFLSSISSITPKVQIAEASGTIYIMADGSIKGTTYIQTADNVTYVFAANINGSIVVQRSNIVVDGNGHTLQGGGGGVGISMSGTANVTARNTQIEAFDYGIWLDSSSGNSIFGNNVTANVGHGIKLGYSSENSIFGNNVTANKWDGIWLYSSSNNNIYGNNVTANNLDGILLEGSSNNTLAGNTMVNNWRNFAVDGSKPSDFVNYVDASNTVDGKLVYYWVYRRDMTVPIDAGYVALVDCRRITVQNLTLTTNQQGVLLAYTADCTITKNSVKNNVDGIWLYFSSNSSISENSMTDNGYGICLDSSLSNSIFLNNVTANKGAGIVLDSSSNNNIYGNSVTNNGYGIGLSYPNNMIYNNNFINNSKQASSPPMNTWDDGYPAGGNYWSDYNGTDANHDSIGDTPYIIDANNTDHYPLMSPYIIPEFPIFFILPLFIIATVPVVLVYRRKLAQREPLD